MLNISVLSTKNDPDYIKLKHTKFEINKIYLDLINSQLSNSHSTNSDDVVVKNDKANYTISRGSLARLKPGKWLNDEIINSYINLVNLRTKDLGLIHAYTFNTFFYTLLEQMHDRSDYSFVKL